MGNKLKVLFKGPGWNPANPDAIGAIPEVNAATFERYNPEIPLGLSLYALAQFVPSTIIATIFLKHTDNFLITEQIGFVLLILFTLLNLGGIFELKKWVLPAEIIRLFVIVSVVFSSASLTIPVKSGIILMLAALLTWFLSYRSLFLVQPEPNKIIEVM